MHSFKFQHFNLSYCWFLEGKSCASWQILAVFLRCFAGLWFGPIYRLCVEYAQAIVLGTSYGIALRSATDREHIVPQWAWHVHSAHAYSTVGSVVFPFECVFRVQQIVRQLVRLYSSWAPELWQDAALKWGKEAGVTIRANSVETCWRFTWI